MATRCCWPPERWVGRSSLATLEPEAGEQLACLGVRFLPAQPLGADDAERDVVEHAQVREQVEGLEDETELAADPDRVDGRIGDHVAVEEDVAVVDLGEQVDAAEQGRLARPGGADQRHRLVLVDGDVDPLQHLEVVEGLGHAANLDHGRFRSGSACS